MRTITIKSWGAPGHRPPPHQNGNWGDAINEDLAKFIVGPDCEVKLVEAIHRLNEPNFVAIGSILRFADNTSTVWGTGFLTPVEVVDRGWPKIVAVRGPKTRRRLRQLGFDVPAVYGDPGLLFEKFYKPNVEKKYKLGIVPHWLDNSFSQTVMNAEVPDDVVIVHHSVGTYKYVDLICSCERVASASLHGLIVADSYGIPNVQIKFLSQELFKYQDYYESIGRPFIEPVDFSNSIEIDRMLNLNYYTPSLDIDLDKLLAVCPF